MKSVRLRHKAQGLICRAYHPGARKDIPAETDTIAFLDIAPLLFESLIIHLCHVDFAAQPVAIGKLQACLACGLVAERIERVEVIENWRQKGDGCFCPKKGGRGVDGAEELGVV